MNPPGQAGALETRLAAAPVDDNTYRQQVGYLLGSNFGHGLRENQIDPDVDSLIAGHQRRAEQCSAEMDRCSADGL